MVKENWGKGPGSFPRQLIHENAAVKSQFSRMCSKMSACCVHLLTYDSWITGQVIHVDGGMSSLRTFR